MKTSTITRNFILVVLGSAVVAVASCKKTFLEVSSAQNISDNVAIVDSASALTATLGVYDGLQNSYYYGGDGLAAATFLSSGDGLWVGTLNYYNDFTTHAYRSDNTLLYRIWSQIYVTINRANHVIAKVPALDGKLISDTKKNQYVGEAYVIRALAFFDLGRTWGNIPLVLNPTSDPSDVKGIQQSNQQQVYAQVEQDLLAAEPLLPAGVNRNRITQNTVYAFLARLYLYTKQYDQAETYATKIISNSNYSLIDWNTFINNKATNESIFELQFTTADPSSHNGSWSSVNYRNQFCPNKGLYNLVQDPSTGGDRKALIRDVSTPAITNYFVQQLYWRTNGDNPTYIFRLAEQYLIRAEARLNKPAPDYTGALQDLNAVRQRAQVTALTFKDSPTLQSDILAERRVEFALEPQRWYDLVRTKTAATAISLTDTTKYIFPIPYNDLAADPDLHQNPNY
ncbi:Starch-binding associating with outer membrane [Chitinophaga costaii]|uniref:Starch-binding associating with outer membrane n=1 Tax=Chitinophaga costaii TaxID=1335309 RepID=A0A1C4D2M6_9BACT|nr:RagB/SusD family nutrient uptake outer membrane protein [Chitinophaga costaii]PUZ24432.1 RagB/SusD family nutrient uptake outer membrane protein [Chitinophaga costaii]SCC25536.1 Starch-binding associating with outer membrane [Chitinophaga costaii]